MLRARTERIVCDLDLLNLDQHRLLVENVPQTLIHTAIHRGAVHEIKRRPKLRSLYNIVISAGTFSLHASRLLNITAHRSANTS